MIYKIGENAGRIWHLLHQNGPMSMNKIKTTLKMSEADFNQSLGWLAREDKINMTRVKNTINISLK